MDSASPSADRKPSARVPLSVMDLVPCSRGMSRREALENSALLARAADQAGYHRYWVGEQHGSLTFMCASTAVLVQRALAVTERIRVGAGGVVLPNHAPLRVAEDYGTLATLYPGRVDLGVARAPATDPASARALRRKADQPDDFAAYLRDLIAYMGDPARQTHTAQVSGAEVRMHGGTVIFADRPFARVRAVPGEGLGLPVWVLSSSTDGARVAAAAGLPYGFGGHFAAAFCDEAVACYRERFVGSADPGAQPGALPAPRVMLGVHVVVAPTRAEARRLYSTTVLSRADIVSGRPGILRPPTDDLAAALGTPELAERMRHAPGFVVVGEPHEAADQLAALAEEHGADELITLTHVFDAGARRRSVELLAQAYGL